jgi:hypothetical protein
VSGLLDLEAEFDGMLCRPRVPAAQVPAVAAAAARWSASVWKLAQSTPRVELDPATVACGVRIARQPVFICGTHRSGTTLVRDLLDGHPALTVLPSEGTFISGFEERLRRLPQAARPALLGREWLQRLANPINQEPYWLLGRSSATTSAYVDFAQALRSWWPVCEAHLAPDAPSWPLAAVALAYAQVTCGVSERTIHWAEKTPTNERHLERLGREYPGAKFIQIVRHPYAVLASSKASANGWRGRGWTARTVLRNLDVSYRTALARGHNPQEGYLLIRFEELLENLPSAADRIADFLDIEPLPILRQPTVAGQPSVSNSSYDATLPKGLIQTGTRRPDESLSFAEQSQVAAIVGEAAGALGYKVSPIPAWRRLLLRAMARVR